DAPLIGRRVLVDAQVAQQMIQGQDRFPGGLDLTAVVPFVASVTDNVIGTAKALADGLSPFLDLPLFPDRVGFRARKRRENTRADQNRLSRGVQRDGQSVSLFLLRHTNLPAAGEARDFSRIECLLRGPHLADEVSGPGVLEQKGNVKLLAEDG